MCSSVAGIAKEMITMDARDLEINARKLTCMFREELEQFAEHGPRV